MCGGGDEVEGGVCVRDEVVEGGGVCVGDAVVEGGGACVGGMR